LRFGVCEQPADLEIGDTAGWEALRFALRAAFGFRISDFGFLSGFGIRISEFFRHSSFVISSPCPATS